jgi:hypothetical protein
VPADSFRVLLARIFLDLGLRLIGTKEDFDVVLTTETFFLPIQLLN